MVTKLKNCFARTIFFFFNLMNGKGAGKVKTFQKGGMGNRSDDVKKEKKKHISIWWDLNFCPLDPSVLLLTTTPNRTFLLKEVHNNISFN